MPKTSCSEINSSFTRYTPFLPTVRMKLATESQNIWIWFNGKASGFSFCRPKGLPPGHSVSIFFFIFNITNGCIMQNSPEFLFIRVRIIRIRNVSNVEAFSILMRWYGRLGFYIFHCFKFFQRDMFCFLCINVAI